MMRPPMEHHQLTGIETPHDHDVLSGRGNFVNYHTGNEHFRALVRKHKVAYVACPKPQKGKFSQMIVDEIKQRDPPGRFLKQDLKTKFWYDIGEKKALDKTRQALREGAPEIQKELSGEGDDDDDIPRGGSPSLDDFQQMPTQDTLSASLMHGGGNGVVRTYSHDSYDSNYGNPLMLSPPPSAPHVASNGGLTFPQHHHPQQQQQQHQGFHNGMLDQQQQQQQQQHQLQHHHNHHSMNNGMMDTFSNPNAYCGSLNLSPDSVLVQHPVPQRTNSNNCGGMMPQQSYTEQQSYNEQASYNEGALHTNGIRNMNDNNMRNIVFLPQSEPVKDIYFNPLESPRRTNNQYGDQPQAVFGGVERYKVNSSSPQRVHINHHHRRVPRSNKDDFRYEHQPSVSSLAVDKIFSEDKRGSGLGSIKTALGSSTLSVMSLSIDGTDPDSLGPLFNSSLRVSNHASRNHNSRRTINDGDSSSNYEKGMSSIFEMSVNTLGDQLSEFGDSGVMRMTESQAEMSIGNVFDDPSDRESYNARAYR